MGPTGLLSLGTHNHYHSPVATGSCHPKPGCHMAVLLHRFPNQHQHSFVSSAQRWDVLHKPH